MANGGILASGHRSVKTRPARAEPADGTIERVTPTERRRVSGSGAPEVRSPAARRAPPWGMLATLSAVTFLVTGSAIALSPFLLDIARDLGTTLGAVANLVGVMSVSWGVVSVTAGAASDRLGRRPVLVAAMLALGVGPARPRPRRRATPPPGCGSSSPASAGAGSWAPCSRRCPTACRPPSAAARWAGSSPASRSRSCSACPLVTLLGAFGGWRMAVAVHASTALVAAAAVWLAVPPAAAPPGGAGPSPGGAART